MQACSQELPAEPQQGPRRLPAYCRQWIMLAAPRVQATSQFWATPDMLQVAGLWLLLVWAPSMQACPCSAGCFLGQQQTRL